MKISTSAKGLAPLITQELHTDGAAFRRRIAVTLTSEIPQAAEYKEVISNDHPSTGVANVASVAFVALTVDCGDRY